jgi:hypothetical protein
MDCNDEEHRVDEPARDVRYAVLQIWSAPAFGAAAEDPLSELHSE